MLTWNVQVAPSIPGFGFSPAPQKPGWGARETGYAFHALMQQLNYTKYVIQGGDLGAFVLQFMAGDNPDAVVSVLSNFWIIPPNATDLQRYSEELTTVDENAHIAFLQNFETQLAGYLYVQDTKPLQLAIGMTDSPVGFAMWIYNIMTALVDHYEWTPERIITWSMMYYIQGPYGGMRFYKKVRKDVRHFPKVTVLSSSLTRHRAYLVISALVIPFLTCISLSLYRNFPLILGLIQ